MSDGHARFLATVFCVAVLCGCGKSPTERLAGKWVHDPEYLERTTLAGIDNPTAEDIAQTKEIVRSAIASTDSSMEFGADGVYRFVSKHPGGNHRLDIEQIGTWEVSQASANELTVSVDLPGLPPEDVELRFLNDDEISVRHPNADEGRIEYIRAE